MKGTLNQRVEGTSNLQVGGNLTINVGSGPAVATVRLLKIVYLLLGVCIVCTTLPHRELNLSFSLAAALLFLFVITLSWDLHRAGNKLSFNRQKTAIAALALTSITTGCAGPMLASVPDPAILELVKSYKSGVSHGVGFFGLGLEEINIQSAATNGGIKEVYFADQVRGYGLISFAKVSVFGE